VGITGPAPCASLGGVGSAPTTEAVIATVDDLLAAGAALAQKP
jgi:hypothetical protein